MMTTNLVATRIRDDDFCECSGCGKNCRVYYEVIGRYDLKEDDNKNWVIFLCWSCFRPFMKLIEIIRDGN